MTKLTAFSSSLYNNLFLNLWMGRAGSSEIKLIILPSTLGGRGSVPISTPQRKIESHFKWYGTEVAGNTKVYHLPLLPVIFFLNVGSGCEIVLSYPTGRLRLKLCYVKLDLFMTHLVQCVGITEHYILSLRGYHNQQ